MRELSLHVLDIVQNSIAAGAGMVAVRIGEDRPAQRMTIVVEDNGRGMTAEQIERVTNPFFTTRTTRRVGLGVPLFKMAAEMTGGSFWIESQLGRGTRVTAEFCTSHLDMIPLGDMDSTVLTLIGCNPQLDFIYEHRVNGRMLLLDTRQLKETLDGVPLDTPEVMAWIGDYLKEQRQTILEEAKG